MSSRPNIILTIADDQRHDMIGALGDPMVKTPKLDRLVAEGAACTHAFHQGSMVAAVCAPSRAMLHSGRNLFHLPHELLPWIPQFMSDVPDPGSVVLLGEHLRRNGYRTFGIGKWHNRRHTYARSFDGGDAIFFGGMSEHDKVPLQQFDPTGQYADERTYVGDKFSTDLFVDAAVRFLEEYSGDQPFFLYVAFTSPHDPRTPPRRWADQYEPNDFPLPGNFMPEHPFDNGELDIRDEQLAAKPRDPSEIRRHIADYYAMVSELDEGLGRIDDALRRSGRADDTIRIHTADHGLAVGQHGLMGKQNLYEHSVRVPLVFRGPGIPQGRRTDALCYMHDLYPTICDLAGIDTPDTCESQSLLPVITGESDRHRDHVCSAYMGCQRMARDERYKLIEYTVGGTRRLQLFDLRDDPLEIRDRSDDPSLTDRVKVLRSQLRRWQVQVGDPLPAP